MLGTKIIKATTDTFASVVKWSVIQKNKRPIFIKLVSRGKREVLQTFLGNGCTDFEAQWTNTSR